MPSAGRGCRGTAAPAPGTPRPTPTRAGAAAGWRRWSARWRRRCSSFPRLLAEQALRLEDHDQDEDREHHRGRPDLPEVGIGDRLDDADDQPADDRALEVADAAHDRRGEGDQAGGEALVVLDRAVVE